MSGLVVLDEAGEERSGLDRSEVVFKRLTDAEKQRYVDFGEWQGRSGGYAIQTLGSTLVERLEGSVSNVVGLPVGLLVELAPTLFLAPVSTARADVYPASHSFFCARRPESGSTVPFGIMGRSGHRED